MKACPYCGKQYPDEAVVCSLDQQPLDGPTESKQKVSGVSLARVVCPACGASDDYTPTVELRGSFSWPVFFAGGLPAVLFRNAGRSRKVRCNKCEAVFDIRTRLSKVTGFSWFDFPGDPAPGADRSYLQLHQLLDAQRERSFPTEQTVLFGFSQGCLMVWEAGVRYPHRLAGCIGVSGFMREPDQLLKLRSPFAGQQRFCITHGMMDDLIPIEESQKQVELVQQAGLQVEWKTIVKGHTIDPFGEMMLIRRFIERCFTQNT